MERDPKTGRFLPGNQAAVGNRGNTKPKWLNKNAEKHGFYATAVVWPHLKDDGCLYLTKLSAGTIQVKPNGFYVNDDGLFIRNDIIEQLREVGFMT